MDGPRDTQSGSTRNQCTTAAEHTPGQTWAFNKNGSFSSLRQDARPYLE